MPSPFPGMDPYLEDPHIWPDVHNRLAEKVSEVLNRSLPSQYYAQLDVRSEVGVVDEPISKVIVPDVNVLHTRQENGGAATAVAAPRASLSDCWEIIADFEPVELCSIEVRDRDRAHEVVTLIEILSPSNKRPGRDRNQLLAKRNVIMASETSLVEIDLLRTGARLWQDVEIPRQPDDEIHPTPDYLVSVNRSWDREGSFRLQLFPAWLDGQLPVFPVPLRYEETELHLDLQYLFVQVYDSGPYRRGAVNYAEPAQPPLPDERQTWAAEHVREWFKQ